MGTQFLNYYLLKVIPTNLLELSLSMQMNSTQGEPQTGLPSRWMLRDRLMETSFTWGGEPHRRVQLSLHNDLALLSATPKPLFEPPAANTLNATDAKIIEGFMARMNLISPLIDLTTTKHYRRESSDGIKVWPSPLLVALISDLLPLNFFSQFATPIPISSQ